MGPYSMNQFLSQAIHKKPRNHPWNLQLDPVHLAQHARSFLNGNQVGMPLLRSRWPVLALEKGVPASGTKRVLLQSRPAMCRVTPHYVVTGVEFLNFGQSWGRALPALSDI